MNKGTKVSFKWESAPGVFEHGTGEIISCYKCKRPDCSDLPLPPEPAFVETRARDAGQSHTRP